MRRAIKAMRAVLTMASVTILFALPSGASGTRMYSATAVSQIPGQPVRRGRIVKSGADIRLEYTRNGKQIIQIVRPTKGLMYFLDPASKTYSTIKGQAVPEESVTGYKSPCPPNPASRCQRMGQAVISGIQAERWLISTPGQQGGSVDILWDPARRHALSETFPDGRKTLMSFRAMETVSGRPTERWDVTMTQKGQAPIKGEWWFDPDLRVVVRQSIPGGESRRLDDLKVAPYDAALFVPPAGWREVAPAARPDVPQIPANN